MFSVMRHSYNDNAAGIALWTTSTLIAGGSYMTVMLANYNRKLL